MLYAGSDDGVYRISGVRVSEETTAEKVLDTEQVYRICQFDGIEGLFATTGYGLYYSPDGDDWQELSLPEEQVYAVTASPSGEVTLRGHAPRSPVRRRLDGGRPDRA